MNILIEFLYLLGAVLGYFVLAGALTCLIMYAWLWAVQAEMKCTGQKNKNRNGLLKSPDK